MKLIHARNNAWNLYKLASKYCFFICYFSKINTKSKEAFIHFFKTGIDKKKNMVVA